MFLSTNVCCPLSGPIAPKLANVKPFTNLCSKSGEGEPNPIAPKDNILLTGARVFTTSKVLPRAAPVTPAFTVSFIPWSDADRASTAAIPKALDFKARIGPKYIATVPGAAPTPAYNFV